MLFADIYVPINYFRTEALRFKKIKLTIIGWMNHPKTKVRNMFSLNESGAK